MLNIGLDFSFFGGRLGGTIEYYDKRTSDLIYTYEVSTNRYPFGTMPANVGDISNKGIEFTINATPIQTKNFSWQTSLNLSHNKNNVESISNSEYSVDISVQPILKSQVILQMQTYSASWKDILSAPSTPTNGPATITKEYPSLCTRS